MKLQVTTKALCLQESTLSLKMEKKSQDWLQAQPKMLLNTSAKFLIKKIDKEEIYLKKIQIMKFARKEQKLYLILLLMP